jgi:hypothetical protein
MMLGFHCSRVAHASHAIRRVSVRALFATVIVLNMAAALPAEAQNSTASDGDHNQKDECPPETEQPPQNCNDIRRIAYKNALRRGYVNTNGNGVPDVMERGYRVGFNDCSTGNAHMACMFNDPCTEKHGELLGMRSNSAHHATTLYRGNDGKEFECDFTPQSSGIFIRNRRDARVGPAFPDRGESIDPQYAKDGCETNGASTSLLNPGGGLFGGGGSMQDMMMMMMIMQLLNGQNNQNDNQPSPDNQSTNNEVIVPTPTQSPTPTPVPTRTPDTRTGTTSTSTTFSDAGIVSVERDSSIVESLASAEDDVESGDSVDESIGSGPLPKAEWEEKRDGMF